MSPIAIDLAFDAILVPQGQEYQAVCRGLQRSKSKIGGAKPQVIAIPLGVTAVADFLRQNSIVDLCQKPDPKLLLMGLAGGISPQHQVGDLVIYRDCIYPTEKSNYYSQQCDRELTDLLQKSSKRQATLVSGLTSKHLVYSTQEKQEIDRLYPVSVVDMEGYSLLEGLRGTAARLAIVRVISDDCRYDIPDLNPSFRENGSIDSLLLAIALIKQPLAARRLIVNSLYALSILERAAEDISLENIERS